MAEISTTAAGTIINKKLFNKGSELHKEEFSDGSGLEWMDYGARMYDGQLGRWWEIDPLSDSMRNFSPYNFSFNNPLRFIDPDGNSPKDIIVLNDPKGAKGLGHTAVLIGNDKTGWTFISKEGRNKSPWYSNGVTGGPSLKKEQTFNTLEAFKKTQESDNDLNSYTESVRFATSEEQDKVAIKETEKSADSWYHIAYNNCADAVSDGLKTANLDPGYTEVIGSDAKTGKPVFTLSATPNIRFNAIKENNKAKIVQ